MKKLTLLPLFICSCIFSSHSSGMVEGKHHHREHEEYSGKKLYVFGDSYADTGNWNTTDASCWKLPYGITYPGKPAGRFSDGRILTDYIASYMKIKTPTPYEQTKVWKDKKKIKNELRFGVNFAYGGTGVFNTDVSRPNMASQIDIFESLINQSQVYNKTDLLSSVALVTLGGNDYLNYFEHASNLSLQGFTKSVVKQLVLNLKRIHDVGVPKIAVMTTEPMGCVPAITFLYNFQNCSQALNAATIYHNQLLLQSIESLNKSTKEAPFIVLDVYGAFISALDRPQAQSGKSKYVNPLRPCCVGISSKYVCGSVEGSKPKYTLCDQPKLAFFWDKVHPTQNGWYQVYSALQPALKSLF